ncbi:MAG: Cytidine and deoxycytidylate deaminase family protein, partial [uncultured Rubrobacteraceae bacterium]
GREERHAPRGNAPSPRLGGGGLWRRPHSLDHRRPDALRGWALAAQRAPWDRRAVRGRGLREGDRAPARARREPRRGVWLFRVPRRDGRDHGSPEVRRHLRPRRQGPALLRARRQHGAVRDVPGRDPLVRRQAPRLRRPRRGRPRRRLRRGRQTRPVGGRPRSARHNRGAGRPARRGRRDPAGVCRTGGRDLQLPPGRGPRM